MTGWRLRRGHCYYICSSEKIGRYLGLAMGWVFDFMFPFCSLSFRVYFFHFAVQLEDIWRLGGRFHEYYDLSSCTRTPLFGSPLRVKAAKLYWSKQKKNEVNLIIGKALKAFLYHIHP